MRLVLCLVPLLAATATAAPVASTDSMDPTAQQRANATNHKTRHNFTAVPGELPGNDVAPVQSMTLASAKKSCAALDACIGISFKSPTATPTGVVQVHFKGLDSDCGHSRFGNGICPYERAYSAWTYLKDFKPTARKPQWLRHYNLSVVPPRCGDIDIEPLMPFDMSQTFVDDYVACTIEGFGSYILERGECGKLGPNGNPWALPYTKRSNPPSLGTPWFPGSGDSGPGDPGYPGTAGNLQQLCRDECQCCVNYCADNKTRCPTAGCPRCSDTTSVGRCVVCSPSFNHKLSSNSTLVRLWCDPSDPTCKNGEPTRPPKNVRVLADFAPGSPTRFEWTDHNSNPPTSNLTVLDSYAKFSGTVYANTGYTKITTIAPAFKKIDLSGYAERGSVVIEARYPRAHHCYLDPGGGGSECHYEGFKLALVSSTAPKHQGGHGRGDRGYKADLGKAKRSGAALPQGWTTLRLSLTAFSSDWSDYTGECDTKDPDGYQHKCCDASKDLLPEEPCPTSTGLQSIVGLSLWSEGVLGDFSVEIKSIAIET